MPARHRRERAYAGRRPKSLRGGNAGEWSPAVVSAYGDWAPVFDLIGGLRTRAPAAPVARCLRLVAAGGIGTTMSRRAICVLAVGVGADGCDRRSVAVAGGIPAWTRRSDAGWRQERCGHELSSPSDGVDQSRGSQPGSTPDP